MKKNFFGDILGEGGNSEMEPENRQMSERVFIGSDEEEESLSASVQPTLEEETEPFIPKSKRHRARIEPPAESKVSPAISDGVLYVQARRVAELKFMFYKWLALAVPLNVLFFCAAYFQIQPAGRYWFVWPLGTTVLLLAFQYLRAFVLKGRNLHSMVEGTIHEMAMRESRKKRYHDFL